MVRISIIGLLITVLGTGVLVQSQPIVQNDYLQGTLLMSQAEVENFRPQMMEGVHSYFEQVLESSSQQREKQWQRNYASIEAYLQSVAPNRERFMKITGVVDNRITGQGLTLLESTEQKALVAETDAYRVYSVSWPVLEGVSGTGLWIEPCGTVKAQVVALPDADWTPEMLMGLSPGVPAEAQYARRLAEQGCRVIIPLLINREDTFSGNPDIAMTNISHREFIYRCAYQVGRHMIGYEVQKVLAAVDWFKDQSEDLPVAVTGYGEGGLIAMYSTAMDSRIDGVLVSGYFQAREEMWKEPLYRNIWSLLKEFGDAEIAGLIAPRLLVVESCKGPEVSGPPKAEGKRKNVAAPGRLITPPKELVQKEANKASGMYHELNAGDHFKLIESGKGSGQPGSPAALKALMTGLGIKMKKKIADTAPLQDRRTAFDTDVRMHDQFQELLGHVDLLVKRSEKQREKFWEKADPSSEAQWNQSTTYYRNYFWKELIGKMPAPSQPFHTRSRLTYDTPNWKGYWVGMDVWQGVIAGGVLLIPKDIKPGEHLPVVVAQHGLGGRPEPLVEYDYKSAYHSYAAKLADRGYVVYVPQNLYGIDDFRLVQRMANPLKQSVFSITIGQHEQTLKWLKQLPFVDSDRIGFYGLSYGGKSAVRIPPVLDDYKVVICSGDFNEWVWKTTSLDFFSSYMFVHEYEVFEFNLANTFNHAEMANLIAPRPFMVERGHRDGVGTDERVAYEYAKVRRLYDEMGIGDRTTIEFFNGPHEIHGVGTFEFLDKHLMKKK